MAEQGIEVRHQRDCRSPSGAKCNCTPSVRASVWSNEDAKRIRKTFNVKAFGTEARAKAAARTWRNDTEGALRRGEVRAPTRETLKEAAEAWLEGAGRGAIRTGSGDPFKPATIRSYERALRLRALPEFGHRKLSELRGHEVQEFADRLIADDLAPQTIQTTIAALSVICRHHIKRRRLTINPCDGLELPKPGGGRERVASPEEGAALIAALPDEDRALWATAMYAGLRRGELRGLRENRVDLDANVILVEFGWDDVEGEITTKGKSRRRVPITPQLREHLLSHKMRSGRRGDDLLFGQTKREPFCRSSVSERADNVWKKAKLDRITLHECRHTFASLMIAAGCNAKALSTFMGHANIGITFDRYGHLMPGSEAEAAGLLDAYLTKSAANQ